MITYLTKAEEVDEVGTQQVRDPLPVIYLSDVLFRLPISPQLDFELPDMSGYEQPLYSLKGGFQPGELSS